MKKTVLICLAISLMCSLCACTGANGEINTSIQTNVESLDMFAKMSLTEESYAEYQKALVEQEKRKHYIDIEEQYHAALLQYHKEFTEAYNLGIIDANGKPTGEVDANFDTFFVEQFNTVEELEAAARQLSTKEELLEWLRGQRWVTEGTELSEDDSKLYLDVMLSEFTVSPGELVGFTKESLEAADYEGVIKWLLDFYIVESRNVKYYREKVAKMTEEEIQARVDSLLSQNFESPYTEPFISVVDGRHVLTENTVRNLSVTEDNITPLRVFNQFIYIDTSTLGKVTGYGEEVSCKINEDGTILTLKVNVNGQEETFFLGIDAETNKVHMSVYDIYRVLGMKVYV